jgi:hypothetical protein
MPEWTEEEAALRIAYLRGELKVKPSEPPCEICGEYHIGECDAIAAE